VAFRSNFGDVLAVLCKCGVSRGRHSLAELHSLKGELPFFGSCNDTENWGCNTTEAQQCFYLGESTLGISPRAM
jgi:hypothetical protein